MSKILSLNQDEIETIVRVIDVPLMAFGLTTLLEKTKLTEKECQRIRDLFTSYRDKGDDVQISLPLDDLSKLSSIFDESAEIVDPIEMGIIVGYTWDEAMSLSKKLHEQLK
jgi:hypothetical protein